MLSLRRVALPACALLFALAACSSAPATSATPSPSVTSAVPSATPTPTPTPTPSVSVPVSDSLDAIKVTGERLVAPKVEFKAPFAIDQTRTKVLEEGKGAAALADGYVTVHYYGINARTGKKFDESYSRKQTSTFSLGEVITGFKTGLTGAKAGSRAGEWRTARAARPRRTPASGGIPGHPGPGLPLPTRSRGGRRGKPETTQPPAERAPCCRGGSRGGTRATRGNDADQARRPWITSPWTSVSRRLMPL